MPSNRQDAQSTIRSVKEILSSARAELFDTLVADIDPGGRGPTDFDRFLAQQKSQAIDEAIARLEARMVIAAEDRLRLAAEKGRGEALRSLSVASVGVNVVGVDESTLGMVQALAGEQIQAVAAEVRAKVKVAVTRAIAGATTFRDLQREVRDAFGGDVVESRVERIIRTETVRAFSQSQAATVEAVARTPVADELVKVWRTSGDPRVRSEHALIDGQERELDDLFNVGGGATAGTEPGSRVGFPANGPADPSLPVELSVNCRCTVEYVPRSRARQSYIEKDPEKAAAARRRRQGVRA